MERAFLPTQKDLQSTENFLSAVFNAFSNVQFNFSMEEWHRYFESYHRASFPNDLLEIDIITNDNNVVERLLWRHAGQIIPLLA